MTLTIEHSKKTRHNEIMLTSVQTEILQMMADGKTDKGISEKLKIDEHAIEFHQDLLLKMFNVADIDELITVALREGIIL